MKKTLISIIIIASLFFCLNNANSQNWSQQNSNTTNQLNSISTMPSYRVWACGNNGTVLKTTNGGINWMNVSGNGIPTSLNLENIFMHKMFIWPPNNSYVYATGTDSSSSYIYMTTNDGLNWNKVLTVTGQDARINGIWFRDTTTGFAEGEPVAGRWSFWKTTDRGLTWDSAGLYFNGQNYTGFPNNLCGRVNTLNDYLYIGANYNSTETRILRSTDFGNTWTELNPGISKKLTSIFFIRPDIGMIGSDNYLYYTTNSGNNWNLSENLPYTPNFVGSVSDTYSIVNFYLKTDSVGSQTIYRSWTWNYWYEDISGISGLRHMQGIDFEIWAVGDSGKIYKTYVLYPYVRKIGNEIPELYILYQNYPNPFNPSTSIRFDLKNSSNVKLIVYNIQGKEITTLVNENLNAGSYEVDWNASSYPSGVYFYRIAIHSNKLQTENFSDTRRMVMIK
jgi:photosystem II stability/assembly factor-like uncharacterized protein